jgi:sulfur carrier protein ThiS
MNTPTLRDAERYVGRAYVEGEFDCASLAVLVQAELFGRRIDLPVAADRHRGRRGQASDIQRLQPEVADLVSEPRTGDAVILWALVPEGLPPLNRQWHVGTVFVQGGETWILHCANEAQGVALQRLDHLLQLGMHLDGFYAWRVAAPAAMLNLAIAAHPLTGQVEVRQALAGRTLADTLAAEGVTGTGWVVSVGGLTVPPALWSKTRVRAGHLIEARSVVRKKALAVVAVLVLSYFTFGAGGLGAGGLFAAGGAVGGGFLAAAAVYVGGSMLISKLLAPKAGSAGDNSSNQPAPTYALQGGRNRARPYEPLSLVLGYTKAVPDNANQPYTWFEGDDQFLATMFHAGINCRAVSEIKLGDTAIESYEGAQISRYGFSAGNTGVPPIVGTSVDSVEGGLLDAPTAPGPWVTRTSSPGTVQLGVDLEMSLSFLNEKGKYQTANVQVEVQARQIGEPQWTALGAPVFQSNSATPLRRTLMFVVPSGQYEVRLRKLADANYTIPGASNVVSWSALKSYQPDTADYGGQPRVNVRLKATGQLSGAPDEINWMALAETMPYWNGSAWVTATEPGAAGVSNPGAQILMLLRGIYRPSDGRLIAGAGLADNRIDIESLKGFMVRCAAKGFRFDSFIQQAMNLQDLLESIASAGLGSLSRHSGRIGVIWMAEDQPIEGVINMAAMKARSFGVQYDLMATADEYQLEFFDADRGWTWQPVRVQAPGIGTPQRTSTENVRGVTRAAHAAVIARFAMGQNIYGRKSITFDMDLEHLTFRRGSVLAISHDLTQWGYGGRVVAVITGAGQFSVEVDEPVPVALPATRTLGLRLSGEQQMRVFNVASVSANGRVLTVAQGWPGGALLPGVGSAVQDTVWLYDFKATPGYRVRVTSIEPVDNMGGAQVTVVPESPEFWNYVLNGAYEPPPNNSLLSEQLPVASNLRISRARVRQGEGWVHELTAVFDVVGNYDHAQLWTASGGMPLSQVGGSIFGTRVTWTVAVDQSWTVEIRPFDALGRMGTRVSDVFVDPSESVVGVLNFFVRIEDAGAVAHWSAPAGLSSIDWAVTQIRTGATWEGGLVVFEGRTDRALLGWLKAGTQRFWAAHRNSAGDWSMPVTYALEILPPIQPIVDGKAWRDQVELAWQECTSTQPLRGYEIRVGPIFAQAQIISFVTGLGYVRTEAEPGKRLYWVIAVDMGGNRGAAGYKEVETLPSIGEALDQLQEGLDEQIDEIRDLVNANGSAVREVVEVSEQLEGKLSASYTLAVSAGKRVSGLRAFADEQESSLVFLANRFAFAIGDADQAKQLLTLGTVNGTPSAGLAGNFYLDGVLKSRMVDAEQILGTHIRGDEIEARHVKTGSLTTDLLNVGMGSNLLANSTWLNRQIGSQLPQGWNVFSTIDPSVAQVLRVGDASGQFPEWMPEGAEGTCLVQLDANPSTLAVLYSDTPAIGGKRYEASAYAGAHRCRMSVGIEFYDQSGGNLPAALENSVDHNGNTDGSRPGGRLLSAFKRVGCFAIAPPTAAKVRITLYRSDATTQTSYAFYLKPMLAEASPHQSVFSPYQPSGIGTQITPTGITTPSLSALSGNMGTLSAGQLDIHSDAIGGGGWGWVRSPGKWRDGNHGWILARHANGDMFVDFTIGGLQFAMQKLGGVDTAYMDWGGIAMDNAGNLSVRALNVIGTGNIVPGSATLPAFASAANLVVMRATPADRASDLNIYNYTSGGAPIRFSIGAVSASQSPGEPGGGE